MPISRSRGAGASRVLRGSSACALRAEPVGPPTRSAPRSDAVDADLAERGAQGCRTPTARACGSRSGAGPRFIERYPKIEVEVQVEDRFADIVSEGLDAGIRLTEAIERDMVQVRLSGPGRFVVAGAASYLARRGTPQKPAEHDCICVRSTTSGGRFAWELERGKKDWRVPV